MSSAPSDPTEPRVLVITHTAMDGTTLDGTTRADDLYPWLRSQGWNFRRSVPDFRLLGSPGKPAKRYAIDRTAEGLRERGFDVRVEIDDEVRAFESTESDRAIDSQFRARGLTARSQRLASTAAAKEEAGRRVLDSIPLGQPYLVDHPGYAADRNRRERALKNQQDGYELGRLAERIAEQAETASNHMAYRNNPETVANRIRTFEAEQRAITREVKRADDIDEVFASIAEAKHQAVKDEYGITPFTAEHREQLAVRAAWLTEQLRGWHEVREQQIADGKATNYTKDTIDTGDFVKRHSGWFPVLKVNKVSVTVPSPSGGWTTTIRFEHISDHVGVGDERWETAKTNAIVTGTQHVGNCGPHASIKALMDP